jgi:6-phosphofructokinase
VAREQEIDEDNLDADQDGAPLWLHNIDDVIGDATAPGLARRVLNTELNFTSADELASFKEAEKEVAWQGAMSEEMKTIEDNKTWELTMLPAGHRAIDLKWVYKVKWNEAGDVVQHKARLVVKGYVQRAGIDFDEVFALVAWLESVRMLVALAAHERWEVHHMDVKSAFLNGMIKEEVYVQQSLGFIITSSEHKVLRLRKVLYGLRQAPRA